MDSSLILFNLLNPPVLFFFLGMMAIFLKSDLEIPQPLPKLFSLYLLLAIGFKGGYELDESGISLEIVITLLAAIIMACAVPAYTFFILKIKLDVYNAAAIAATYGSISAVTFISASSFLDKLSIHFDGYMVAALALMESPAIIVGILLVRIFGSHGPEIQAFALCALVAVAGIWTTQRWMPDLPGAERSQRLLIVTTGLWAFGVIAVVTGLVEDEPLLVAGGVVPIVLALAARRIAGQPADQGVNVRAGGAALAAGLVLGFSQAIPMLVVPAFFTAVQGIDGMIAMLSVAPFAIALFVAGTVAGWLLERYSPRAIITSGTLAIALANVMFYFVMHPDSSYLLFIVPFALVGGGFVIGTAVRTAVIFAATPAHLPATAAAL
nr:sodium-dependent bicarbonate transport family permease [Oscillatoria sp. Prado101]